MEKEEPIEYKRGFSEFLGCKIDLSKRPLIPRKETEFWVKLAIKDILTFSRMSECRVLDMFAGSGCIGLAVKKHIKNAHVIFSDIDVSSLIRANKRRCDVVRSDVFSNIKGKFDYIFANPPYVATSKKHLVQKSVLEFEPRKALFAGKDGMFYINKFLRDAKKHLNPAGKIFMEFSPEQKKGIESLLKKYKYNPPAGGWQFHKDQYGKYRWVVIK